MRGKGPGWNLLLGSAMIVWQNLQPPVNPAAPLLDPPIERAVELSGLDKNVPRFNLHILPVALVDSAALGLITTVLFGAGVFLALRRNPDAWRSWRLAALATGLVCILLALSHFVSGSSGRAYCGFLYFALPLVLLGWNLMRPRALKWCLYLSLSSSLVSVIFYPSHPLWPARWAQQELAATPRFQRLAERMNPYLKYSERAVTGEELMQAVPDDEPAVVVLLGEDRPLLPLFRPYSQKTRLLFLPPHATPRALNGLGARYIVVGGGADESYPELCTYLAQSGDYELVARRDYTSKLVRGPETWTLYRSVNLTNKPAVSLMH